MTNPVDAHAVLGLRPGATPAAVADAIERLTMDATAAIICAHAEDRIADAARWRDIAAAARALRASR